jgi:hypothetical protein
MTWVLYVMLSHAPSCRMSPKICDLKPTAALMICAQHIQRSLGWRPVQIIVDLGAE